MSEEKKNEVIKNVKKIFEQANREENKRLKQIFQEVIKDPHYKENMLHYFKQFLTEKY